MLVGPTVLGPKISEKNFPAISLDDRKDCLVISLLVIYIISYQLAYNSCDTR